MSTLYSKTYYVAECRSYSQCIEISDMHGIHAFEGAKRDNAADAMMDAQKHVQREPGHEAVVVKTTVTREVTFQTKYGQVIEDGTSTAQ